MRLILRIFDVPFLPQITLNLGLGILFLYDILLLSHNVNFVFLTHL